MDNFCPCLVSTSYNSIDPEVDIYEYVIEIKEVASSCFMLKDRKLSLLME